MIDSVTITKVAIVLIVPMEMQMILITVKTDFDVHEMNHNLYAMNLHVVLSV